MPYKGQRKKIDPSKSHGYIGEVKGKAKKPTPWVENPVITQYKKDRNMHWLNDMFTSEELKEQILLIYPI